MIRFSVRPNPRLGITLLTVVLAACGDDGSPTNGNGNGNGNGDPVPTTSVSVRDSETFNPEDILVASGATVQWTWQGGIDHNVTWVSADLQDSPTQTSGTHSVTMPSQAGTYSYYCTLHGTPTTGMHGSVVVE